MKAEPQELTFFERGVLDSVAAAFGDAADAFRKQVETVRVIGRENTIVGFYTLVDVDRTVCAPVPMWGRGGHFDVDGIEHGVGIMLWDRDGDGYLDTIEGWTTEDSGPFDRIDFATLRLVRLNSLHRAADMPQRKGKR